MNRIRKCISCGKFKERKDLIKITNEKTSGKVFIEPNSKIFGRSVYLCYNQNCIDDAFKKSRVNKVLKTNTRINKSELDNLLSRDLKGTTDGQFKS